MNERLVLMPCRCRRHLDYNLALKEVTVLDETPTVTLLKIKCLYCHQKFRIKIGVLRFYEMFGSHLGEVNDGNKSS